MFDVIEVLRGYGPRFFLLHDTRGALLLTEPDRLASLRNRKAEGQSADMADTSLILPVNPLVRKFANCYSLSASLSTANRDVTSMAGASR